MSLELLTAEDMFEGLKREEELEIRDFEVNGIDVEKFKPLYEICEGFQNIVYSQSVYDQLLKRFVQKGISYSSKEISFFSLGLDTLIKTQITTKLGLLFSVL